MRPHPAKRTYRFRSLLAATLALAALAACRSAAPPARQAQAGTAPATRGGHRVILLSLDGSSAQELHRLHQEGKLTEGGFERFFREGDVAEGMIPVNPSLTSVNHISLATGKPAAGTGIVGNTYHPSDAPWGKTVSGFAADIGAETLWEAARRQGKRAAVTTWPGADGVTQRRTADWGMIYVNNPDRPSDLLTLTATDWREASPGETAGAARSHSPLRSATLASEPLRGTPADSYRLLALDSTDDGKVGYDAVSIAYAGANGPAKPVLLRRGAWGNVPCSIVTKTKGRDERRAGSCAVKLLELDPGLARLRLYFGGVYPLRAYPDSFQADLEKRGLVWSGPPNDGRLEAAWNGEPGIDLDTWSEESERFTRFFGDGILAAAGRDDWDLLMSYMPVIDEAGHELLLVDPRQPGFSEERSRTFEAARLRTWRAVDREIARIADAVDLSRTTIVLVSDHGMSPVHTSLDPNVLLRRNGLLAADDQGTIRPEASAAIAVPGGGICHVYVHPGQESTLPRIRQILSEWKVGPDGAGGSPIEKMVTRSEAGELGLDSPNSGDLILFAREGYSFHGNALAADRAESPTDVNGMHGYLNHHRNIHAIYLALGSGVRKGETKTLRSIDVAARVSAWLGMKPPGEK